MKKYIILLFALLVSMPGFSSRKEDMQKAGDAYSRKDFRQASELYEKAIKDYGESAEIYYNTGNCYFKQNKIAQAILNYERSLLLEPGDGDARYNLEFAKSKTVDKIESLDEIFISSWFNGLQNLHSTDKWARIAIGSFVILIGALVLYFFSRKIILRKTGFYLGIIFLCLTILSNVFAYRQMKKLNDRNTAIVMVATTTIKSSPDESGTGLFILHEGAKVNIRSKLSNWLEIRTDDGNVGWIRKEEIEII